MSNASAASAGGANTSPLLVPAREAAALLSISERTLWTLTRRGDVRCRKIGRAVRYYVGDLLAYAEGRASDGQRGE